MASAQDLKGGGEVQLTGLVKRYGRTTAVDDVNVTVKPGEFFTLLGPSGSGKTTTMMMIAGFVFPSAGGILMDGQDISSLPPQRRELGVVFQNYAVFPHLTAAENVAFPLRARRCESTEIKRRVIEMLDLVRLSGYAERLPRQLSGGQIQRIALARALIFRPRVLLMDEPLGALDKKLRDQMQLEIVRIHRELGVTVIYVTHDQGEALTMSDRIAIMNNGRIEQVAPPRELYDSPNTRFVADFLGDSNFISGTVIGGENRSLRVRTRSGVELSGITDQSFPVGDDVILAVRPEKISITATDHGPNCVTGVVEEVVYVGESSRYVVRSGDISLTLKVQNRLANPAFRVGDSLSASWSPTESRIFPGGD